MHASQIQSIKNVIIMMIINNNNVISKDLINFYFVRDNLTTEAMPC